SQIPHLLIRQNVQLGGEFFSCDPLSSAQVDRGWVHTQLPYVIGERRYSEFVIEFPHAGERAGALPSLDLAVPLEHGQRLTNCHARHIELRGETSLRRERTARRQLPNRLA